jgi:hypothetical protein
METGLSNRAMAEVAAQRELFWETRRLPQGWRVAIELLRDAQRGKSEIQTKGENE